MLQLGVQPGLQVTGGQSVLGAAVMGPLTGNSCPGDGSTPCPGLPGRVLLPDACPAGTLPTCESVIGPNLIPIFLQ